MKYYRDLQAGETLQAGDEWKHRHPSARTWHTIPPTSSEVGQLILPGFSIDYRRPVDAIPREEYERLQKELVRTRGQRNKHYEAERANYDEANRLRQQLADERAEHARTMQVEALKAMVHNDRTAYRSAVAAMQSQPRLQRVTPEAMAELESREAWVILFRHKESIHCRYCIVRWDARAGRWWGTPAGEENPLDWHWYIEPSTIPEVT